MYWTIPVTLPWPSLRTKRSTFVILGYVLNGAKEKKTVPLVRVNGSTDERVRPESQWRFSSRGTTRLNLYSYSLFVLKQLYSTTFTPQQTMFIVIHNQCWLSYYPILYKSHSVCKLKSRGYSPNQGKEGMKSFQSLVVTTTRIRWCNSTLLST